jgi:tagatose 6-phosphate kinase
MILTVTLNPAWDVTYRVPELTRHGSHRVASALQRPGGKGLNVARVLHALGEPVTATGLLGGATGALVADALEVPHGFAAIAGETRRTVTVVDTDATIFNEPGPEVRPDE